MKLVPMDEVLKYLERVHFFCGVRERIVKWKKRQVEEAVTIGFIALLTDLTTNADVDCVDVSALKFYVKKYLKEKK